MLSRKQSFITTSTLHNYSKLNSSRVLVGNPVPANPVWLQKVQQFRKYETITLCGSEACSDLDLHESKLFSCTTLHLVMVYMYQHALLGRQRVHGSEEMRRTNILSRIRTLWHWLCWQHPGLFMCHSVLTTHQHTQFGTKTSEQLIISGINGHL